MSTNRRPARRHSQRVYWRRRIVLLALLVAVIVVIVLIVAHATDGRAGHAGAGASTQHTAAVSPAPVSSDLADPTTSPATPEATASGKPGQAAQCTTADVQVVAHTDATSYAAGVDPKFSLSLTNTGTTPCRIDAGTAAQDYTVTSGSDVYWRSADCQTDAQKMVVLLAAGKTVSSAPFAWDRTESNPKTCYATTQTAVPANGATYRVSVSVDGIASAKAATFVLR